MRTVNVKGLDISVLSLGTVQLGCNYGINNKDGQPSMEQSFGILDAAMETGVNTLDTAAGYGDSEMVIGNWLKTVPAEKQPFICTKAKHLDHTSLETLRASLKESVEESKKRLGLSQIPLLMLHDCDEYFQDEENMKICFKELKENGDILYSGISAYAHHDYKRIAESGFDATQIPLNIFDWRQIDNGGLKALKDSGMIVFVRSVYLQGLVFQKPEELDPKMEFARETLVKFRALCDKFEMDPASLSLSFVLSLPGVTSLVLGAEKKEQVIQNAETFANIKLLNEEQMEEIHANFKDSEYRLLTPSEWFNAQK
ncbi:MAG: aldo/keto reductase [Eubacteriales bacterium]|nr:aldo/keto reductase [Eubacteriales bacterium]